MAERVTSEEVKKLIDTQLADVAPFIKAAHLTVDQHLLDSGLGAPLLKEIERWLAAHFVAMRERSASQESVGDASVTYGGKFGMGLNFTQYGQQVSLLDTTGRLASAGSGDAFMKVL